MMVSHVHPSKTFFLYFICINRLQANTNPLYKLYAEKSALFSVIFRLKAAR